MEKEPTLFFGQDITVYVDYHFFYIQDKEEVQESLEDNWNDQAIKMMLATNTHTVGIRTARNDEYIVHLSVFNDAPMDDFKDWDYVIETNIYVPSGKIRVAGPIEYLPETTCIHLPNNGYYKVRAYYGKLRTVNEDELEGDDHYKIILWPSEDRTLNVLKPLAPELYHELYCSYAQLIDEIDLDILERDPDIGEKMQGKENNKDNSPSPSIIQSTCMLQCGR